MVELIVDRISDYALIAIIIGVLAFFCYQDPKFFWFLVWPTILAVFYVLASVLFVGLVLSYVLGIDLGIEARLPIT